MPDDLLRHPEIIRGVLSHRPCGLLTDIDGTISEIAPRPVDAKVSAICRARLATLAGLLDLVAVVSGRPISDSQRMVGIPELLYVGDHGLERTQNGEAMLDLAAVPYRAEVRAAAGELYRRLSVQAGLEGLFLEDKGASFSFHYRLCQDADRARAMILEAMASLNGTARFRTMEARRSIELRPPLEINKGTALESLAREHALQGLFYLGDDHTDVSAFRALGAWRRGSAAGPPERGLAIAVVSGDSPADARQEADFILGGIPAVEGFLGLLVHLLQPGA